MKVKDTLLIKLLYLVVFLLFFIIGGLWLWQSFLLKTYTIDHLKTPTPKQLQRFSFKPDPEVLKELNTKDVN